MQIVTQDKEPPVNDRSVTVHVFGRTDVGRTREHNEDAFVVADLSTGNATLQPEVRTHVIGERGTLFMVADGMGGAAAGEIASAMAIEVVLRELTDNQPAGVMPTSEDFAVALKRATAAANAQIHVFAQEHPEFRGMGTTATAAGVLGNTLFLAQVGDSRAYLVRDSVARQITKDQSLIQKLVEAGELTEEEAEQSERRNIILQALGPESSVKVDLTHQRLRHGDTLVLCSDGLSGLVKQDDIAQIVNDAEDLVTACKRLIDRANENGGPDNITVITARFEGPGLVPDSTDDAVRHTPYPHVDDSGAMETVHRPTPAGIEITGPMPTYQRRPTAKLPDETYSLASSIPADESGQRSRGSLIALILLIMLLASALWYVYRSVETVMAPRHGGAEPGAVTRP